jgi:hypothetical protein
MKNIVLERQFTKNFLFCLLAAKDKNITIKTVRTAA